MYFNAKYDIKLFPIKKALGKKRVAIFLSSESALENPQNTASLRLKSRLAEKAVLNHLNGAIFSTFKYVRFANVIQPQKHYLNF